MEQKPLRGPAATQPDAPATPVQTPPEEMRRSGKARKPSRKP